MLPYSKFIHIGLDIIDVFDGVAYYSGHNDQLISRLRGSVSDADRPQPRLFKISF